MGYTTPFFEVRRVDTRLTTTGYTIFPSGVTTDDLCICANPVDTSPLIQLLGAGAIVLRHATASNVQLLSGGTAYLTVGYATPDISLVGLADKNIFLSPSGTGVVKFGTYTAGAATDSTGYITIQDAAGNTRKLMVQA